MYRMTETERLAWRDGTAKESNAVGRRVEAGEFHCDECEKRALAITAASDTPVYVECAEHFKARLSYERSIRPSREELVARVNLAIAPAA